MKKNFLIAMVVAMMLAGCTDLDTGFDASMSVDSTTSAADGDGFCGYDDDDECHSVTVTITNNGEDEVSTNMFYWDATASSGGVYNSPSVDGPDACAGGASCTVTLHFDVTNGDSLTSLSWDDGWDSMDTSIPAY